MANLAASIHDIVSWMIPDTNMTKEIIYDPYGNSQYATQLQIAQGIYLGIAFLVLLLLIIYLVLKYLYGFFRTYEYGYSQAYSTTIKITYAFFLLITMCLSAFILYSSVELGKSLPSATSETSQPYNSSFAMFGNETFPTQFPLNETISDRRTYNIIYQMAILQQSLDGLREQRIRVFESAPSLKLDATLSEFNHTTLAVSSRISNETTEGTNLEIIAANLPQMIKTFSQSLTEKYVEFADYLRGLFKSVQECALPISANWLPPIIIASLAALTCILSFFTISCARPRFLGYIYWIILIGLFLQLGFTTVSSIYYNDLCSSSIKCVCQVSLQSIDPSGLVNSTALAQVTDHFEEYRSKVNALADEGGVNVNDFKSNFTRTVDLLAPVSKIVNEARDQVQSDFAGLKRATQECTTGGLDSCRIATWLDNILFWGTVLGGVLVVVVCLAFHTDAIFHFKFI